MKKWILLCVLTVGMVLPVQAAPSSKTLLWQNMLLKKIAPMFCSVPGGKLSGMFKITEKECMTTFNYAAQKCMNGIEKIPFYTIEDRYTGQQWGKVIGTCIGMAYDLKYSYKKKFIP